MNERKIQFRAWNKEIKQMGCSLPLRMWTDSIAKESKAYLMDIDNLILMQFTGMKDKNGRMIFEGDIVEFGGVHWTVEYHISGFTLFSMNSVKSGHYIASSGVPIRDFNWMDNGSSGYKQDIRKSFSIKVVGNIYQNKELII